MPILGAELLEKLVAAETVARFDELLRMYGSISHADVDTLAVRARDSSAHVRRNATVLLGLARPADPKVLGVLARETDDPEVFALAAAALPDDAALATERSALLRQALGAADPRVVVAAIRTAARSNLDGLAEALAPRLGDPSSPIRDAALTALAAIGAGPAEPVLRAALVDPAERQRYAPAALFGALLRSDDPTMADAFARSVDGMSPGERVALENALSRRGPHKPWVQAFLLDRLRADGPWRWRALRLLSAAEDAPRAEMVAVARDYLATKLTGDASDEGVSAATAFLGELAGRPFADVGDALAFARAWTA